MGKSVTYVLGHLLPMSPVRTEGLGEGLMRAYSFDFGGSVNLERLKTSQSPAVLRQCCEAPPDS